MQDLNAFNFLQGRGVVICKQRNDKINDGDMVKKN